MNRRDLLIGLGLAGGTYAGAGVVYGVSRGLRFPFLQPEPAPRPRLLDIMDPGLRVSLDGAYLTEARRTAQGLSLAARAYAPGFEIRFATERTTTIELTLANVSVRAAIRTTPEAALQTGPSSGLGRSVVLELPPGEHVLVVEPPFADTYRFTVIGDSGGGSELAWCLERSAQIGADFVLHAGDLYYSDNDLVTLPGVLSASPLPVYASIGNHDFQRGGRNLHDDFTRDVGPRNSHFILGETLFVNFDTAASTWPVGAGERSSLFEDLKTLPKSYEHVVLITHRPLHDPRFQSGSDDAHVLSEREQHWVLERLFELTPKPVLLTGHIHVSAEHFEDGVKTFISGDGLGSRNLASGRAIARILVGEKRPGQPVEYQWQPLEMPNASYCHYKNLETLRLMGKPLPPGSFGDSCANNRK